MRASNAAYRHMIRRPSFVPSATDSRAESVSLACTTQTRGVWHTCSSQNPGVCHSSNIKVRANGGVPSGGRPLHACS